ncbi:MAG: Rho termination factor N-terminal domain-containing protein [Cyanobacteria bacterium P01_D01_bin.1]
MGLRLRKKIRLLPGVSVVLSDRGVAADVKAGPVHWNSMTQRTSVNLPGPLSYRVKSGAKGLTKAQLLKLAKQAGLDNCSGLKKKQIVDLLHCHGIL